MHYYFAFEPFGDEPFWDGYADSAADAAALAFEHTDVSDIEVCTMVTKSLSAVTKHSRAAIAA